MCNVELEHVKSIEISQISRLKSPMKRDTYNIYLFIYIYIFIYLAVYTINIYIYTYMYASPPPPKKKKKHLVSGWEGGTPYIVYRERERRRKMRMLNSVLDMLLLNQLLMILDLVHF